MSWSVFDGDVLRAEADAAVLALEQTMSPGQGRANLRLAEAGGEALRKAIVRLGFLPAGSGEAVEPCGLPFSALILTVEPRWLTGKANELLVLRRCYQSVLRIGEERGWRRILSPLLSSAYYRFPPEEAVRIARSEAEQSPVELLLIPDSAELAALLKRPYRKPRIVSYVGYYRDHAIFALDNGLFARVDLRPEIREVSVIPYFEACYRVGNNPLQPPLPEAEILRLRGIYDSREW